MSKDLPPRWGTGWGEINIGDYVTDKGYARPGHEIVGVALPNRGLSLSPGIPDVYVRN